MNRQDRIYVAGHRGLVGSAIVRKLAEKGYENVTGRTHAQLDLTEQVEVDAFFRQEKPEYVFLAAAKVGGIGANSTYPADFILQNLLIECNVLQSAFRHGVRKLLFLGSSCIYPKMCPQPIKEEYLLTGPLEPTNEAYALAKISGLRMCQFFNRQYGTNYISVMPCNLYGPNDYFDLNNSHVIPALLAKMHQATMENRSHVVLWGTGKPLREFLYVDDLADACVYLMENYNGSEIVNIGTGKEISIRELAELIQGIVGFGGELVFDDSKPDGTPRKVLDVSRLEGLGWRYKTGLEEGLRSAYDWYVRHCGQISG